MRFRSCWTSRKLPTKATKDPKSNSQNSSTCYDRTNVPFECSGNRHTCLTWLREYQFVCGTFRVRQRHRRKRRRRSSQTGRPVGSEQSIDLFTQREEMDIDFRVSRLPQAVVNQTRNFRVRELVKKIESLPHRQALQAELQQSNAYNPFSDESKAMIVNWAM